MKVLINYPQFYHYSSHSAQGFGDSIEGVHVPFSLHLCVC